MHYRLAHAVYVQRLEHIHLEHTLIKDAYRLVLCKYTVQGLEHIQFYTS